MISIARKPLDAGPTWEVPAPDSSMVDYEAHEAYMPSFPLCRSRSSYGAATDRDSAWDRDRTCTKYVRTHAGED